MSAELALRVLALCVLLAGVETLHGIARTTWLVPRIGKERAKRWGVLSGSLLALACCAWQLPGLGLPAGVGPRLALGAVLAGFMAGFDIALARALLRRPWPVVWADFRPSEGNYLSLGLAALALGPLLLQGLGR